MALEVYRVADMRHYTVYTLMRAKVIPVNLGLRLLEVNHEQFERGDFPFKPITEQIARSIMQDVEKKNIPPSFGSDLSQVLAYNEDLERNVIPPNVSEEGAEFLTEWQKNVFHVLNPILPAERRFQDAIREKRLLAYVWGISAQIRENILSGLEISEITQNILDHLPRFKMILGDSEIKEEYSFKQYQPYLSIFSQEKFVGEYVATYQNALLLSFKTALSYADLITFYININIAGEDSKAMRRVIEEASFYCHWVNQNLRTNFSPVSTGPITQAIIDDLEDKAAVAYHILKSGLRAQISSEDEKFALTTIMRAFIAVPRSSVIKEFSSAAPHSLRYEENKKLWKDFLIACFNKEVEKIEELIK